MSTALTPFTANIPESALQDLRDRLARTRWPERETSEGWDQGVPLAYAQELAAYWAQDYDWRRWEKQLNGWPQYMTEIDGIDIQELHIGMPLATALQEFSRIVGTDNTVVGF